MYGDRQKEYGFYVRLSILELPFHLCHLITHFSNINLSSRDGLHLIFWKVNAITFLVCLTHKNIKA